MEINITNFDIPTPLYNRNLEISVWTMLWDLFNKHALTFLFVFAVRAPWRNLFRELTKTDRANLSCFATSSFCWPPLYVYGPPQRGANHAPLTSNGETWQPFWSRVTWPDVSRNSLARLETSLSAGDWSRPWNGNCQIFLLPCLLRIVFLTVLWTLLLSFL